MIVSMNKVRIVGLLAEQPAVLKKLQHFGRVQFVGETEPQNGEAQLSDIRSALADADFCLEFLDKYRVKTRNLLASLDVIPRELSEEDAEKLENDTERFKAAVTEVRGYASELSAVKQKTDRLNALKATLTPWTELGIALGDITKTRHVCFYAGHVLLRDAAAFAADLDEAERISYTEAGVAADTRSYLIAVHKSVITVWEELCKKHNFTATDFSGLTGTAADETTRVDDELALLDAESEKVTEGAGSGELLEYFENMRDLLSVKLARLEAGLTASDTERCFVMTGWVPEANREALDAALAKVTDSIVTEYSEVEEGDDPPVLLKNSRVVKPFESIVDAFSHPAYDDVDPNGLVAIFYSIFFGLMLGDAGYGILLTLACGAVLLFLHPKPGMRNLLGVFLAGGISATLVGVVFGSYFGASLLPALLPVVSESGMPLQLEIPMQMIIFSVALGVLHLFTGYIAMAVKNIRHGHVFAAIFDQGFWILFITGLLMLAGPIAFEGETGALIGTIGKWLTIGSAVVLVATQGRDKKGIIGKFVGGLGSLYNVSGFLGDALSYTRLFALGLSSGIIAWVFNLMSTLVGTDSVAGIIFMVIILLIGHSINIALSLLSAYVHTSRLQYVEFFGKFLEGNGREYSPLARHTSFIEIVPGTARDNIK